MLEADLKNHQVICKFFEDQLKLPKGTNQLAEYTDGYAAMALMVVQKAFSEVCFDNFIGTEEAAIIFKNIG